MLVYGFEISEALIPQGPVLFATEASRDAALRGILQGRLRDEDWRDLVEATAEANFVEQELPADWASRWDARTAINWLLAFSSLATATTSNFAHSRPMWPGNQAANGSPSGRPDLGRTRVHPRPVRGSAATRGESESYSSPMRISGRG